MDMYEIDRSTVPVISPAHAVLGGENCSASTSWLEIVAQIGAEIATPLTTAVERINVLIETGRIDRLSLRALRDEVEAARQAGISGQQLSRFASGGLRQSHERLHLAEVFKDVLSHRSMETQTWGVSLKLSIKSAEVVVDGPLLFSLLNSTLDWALANARSQVEFTIDSKAYRSHARLSCSFERRAIDHPNEGTRAATPREFDSLTWCLIQQTARTMGLLVAREDNDIVTKLTLEFPCTAGNQLEGLSAVEINDGLSLAATSHGLAGSHVLVIASRCELREQIREALHNLGLIIDFVDTVSEAISFCSEGLPHAIVIDEVQRTVRFEKFRNEISNEAPKFVFIEIVETGSTFELSSFSDTNLTRIGSEVLLNSLPPALIFELSKGH